MRRFIRVFKNGGRVRSTMTMGIEQAESYLNDSICDVFEVVPIEVRTEEVPVVEIKKTII